MSINIVNQRYQLTLSISSVNQHYQSTLSINSINQHYQSTLSINSISQHYPSTVSINIVNQRYQWTVSINIINQQSQSKIIAVIKMVLIGIDPYPYINHKIVMALSSRCANHRPQKVAPSWAASRSKTSPRPKHAGIPKNSSIATSCYTALVKNCLARLKKKNGCNHDFKQDTERLWENCLQIGKGETGKNFWNVPISSATHLLEVQVPCGKYRPHTSWRNNFSSSSSNSLWLSLTISVSPLDHRIEDEDIHPI